MFSKLSTALGSFWTIVAGVLILAVLSFLGVQAYCDKRAAQAELGSVKEAVQEAVAARTEAGKVDAKQAKEIVTKRDAVRRVVQKGQDEIKALPVDCVGDAERIRLLNLAIAEVNAVITSSGELPE